MLSGAHSLLLSSVIILGTLLPMVSSAILVKWFLCRLGFQAFCNISRTLTDATRDEIGGRVLSALNRGGGGAGGAAKHT
uniref:Uncharacterized protein n=1 Tax=Trichobilharzia regenti TaxID=157069 RepID=A0AA85IXP0_TRIRE|nr:unnamed protein product [Trichobilharzia regenti]